MVGVSCFIDFTSYFPAMITIVSRLLATCQDSLPKHKQISAGDVTLMLLVAKTPNHNNAIKLREKNDCLLALSFLSWIGNLSIEIIRLVRR